MTNKIPHNNLLLMTDVYKAYGEKVVLDNIDLSVAAGELCTVVGPSGCGKSTLLRLILGQERATRGEIYVDGNPVGYPDPQRGIVYQKYSLFPHLSVLENVMLGKNFTTGLPDRILHRKRIQEEAVYYLEKVDLAEHYQKYPHELSGGMQQRVAIAQALIMKPRIILMDEPFGALDPGTRERMQVFVLQLWEEFDMTVFFVTHDLEEAVYLGTRILVLSQYYSDGRDEETCSRGAKIVADYPLARRAESTMVKATSEFGDLIQTIRREGFDPDYRQHVTDFDLKHPDAFQTLTEEEMRPNHVAANTDRHSKTE
ncbi:MAG: ABC transporter ATP-binding protein [Desulfomonile tiedjei]|uniref:ABC transporter ATP-binding protein n=1 Tax=Desulfomonile tiedjei TaxID=2358 RepID=A0A9D6Z2G7_9BACT|nr:ABC transporter ATP-binding protein [Desulfomonile tiedjei]